MGAPNKKVSISNKKASKPIRCLADPPEAVGVVAGREFALAGGRAVFVSSITLGIQIAQCR